MARSYNPPRLSECRERTPKPEGIGEWAEKLRRAAFDAVKEADITELMAGLLDRAKQGDNAAARIVLDYLTGGRAAAPPRAVSLPPELTELIEAVTERLDSLPKGLPALGDARGPLAGIRNGKNGTVEVVGVISSHASEQEAEAAARRLSEGN